MVIENLLDKRSFGPFASSTGLFLCIGGIIVSFFSLIGLLLALAGAFVAFTSTCSIIDTENRRIKHADYIFGILPYGRWVNIDSTMKLGIRRVNRGYRGYVGGIRPSDIRFSDIRIFLYDSGNNEIMPIKKYRNYESAESDLQDMAALLNIPLLR